MKTDQGRATSWVTMACLLGASLGWAGPPAQPGGHRMPVDPEGPRCVGVSTEPTEQPVPPELRRSCGDGKLKQYATNCWQVVGGKACGVTVPRGPLECERATEVCDGANLAGQSCQSLGYSGGKLACARTCEDFDVSGCSPCLESPGRSCGTLPDVPPLLRVAIGDQAALLVYSPREATGPSRWRSTLVRPGKPPVTNTLTLGDSLSGVEVVPVSGGWVVVTSGFPTISVLPLDANGAAVGKPREVAGLSHLQVVESQAGERYLMDAQHQGLLITPDGVGAPAPLKVPVHSRRGDRVFIVPLAGSGPAEADLVVGSVSMTSGASYGMFKAGRPFGQMTDGAPQVDLETTAGRLSMKTVDHLQVDSWAPKEGKPWAMEEPVVHQVPKGIFAAHSAVEPFDFQVQGRLGVALATFRTTRGTRLLYSLVTLP